MDNQPLVSAVIIFLNAESFIREAVESVFAQSYGNWELLLVDDGSTDGSTDFARRCAQQHSDRVRYAEHDGHENRGMSASRNLGIRQARGRYLAFLDADDSWYANTMEEQVAILEAYPKAAMVYGPIEWWHSWTGKSEDRQRDYVEKLGVAPNRVVEPPRLLQLFLRDKAAVPSGLMVRRQIVERVGGFEDSFRGEYEDQVFCAKICLNAPVFAAGQCWYRYRQHAASSVSIGQTSGETYAARLRFLNWLAQYLSDQRVRGSGVWRALWLEFWRFRHPRAFRLLRRWDHRGDEIRALSKRWGGSKWNPLRFLEAKGSG